LTAAFFAAGFLAAAFFTALGFCTELESFSTFLERDASDLETILSSLCKFFMDNSSLYNYFNFSSQVELQ
jgi:hypothetical protein